MLAAIVVAAECDLGSQLDARKLWRSPPGLTTTIMIHDPILELSVEQLVRALNEKLLMEYTSLQSAIPPPSRALVATLTVEVSLVNERPILEF